MFISNSFYDIKNEFEKGKSSHSYIFYTNDFLSCQKDVNNLIKHIFNVDTLQMVDSDYYIIHKSDKKNILKEDVQMLKNFFQKTSYISKNRIYLIEEAHKLNSSSANMILKFLEEPSKGVVAFFITTNLDAVLSTIKSRCQIINVFYDINLNNNLNVNNILYTILNDDNIYFNLFKMKKKFDKYERGELIEMFNECLILCYNDIINKKSLKKIKVLNKCIFMLNSNVSIDYVFDYLFLGSGE